MRNAYLAALYDLAQANDQVLAIVADNGAIVYDKFRADFPKQFLNFGIAEATMISVSAGLANCGKIPFTYTIIPFLTMRAYEQIRNDVCLQKQNVKIVGVGAGFAYSTLGPTHHAIEDLAIMRILPNMTILSPASPLEAKKITMAAAKIDGPVYIRLGTTKEPEVYEDDYDFQIGKGVTLLDGNDITIVATGAIVYNALQAARELREQGIYARVINLHTIKPIDQKILMKASRETGVVITVEEHNRDGGLGGAVAEVLLENNCAPQIFLRIGIQDVFCKGYGSHSDLREKYGLSVRSIFEQAKLLYAQKQNASC